MRTGTAKQHQAPNKLNTVNVWWDCLIPLAISSPDGWLDEERRRRLTCCTFWYKGLPIIDTVEPVSNRAGVCTPSTVIGISQHPRWLAVSTLTSLGRSESDVTVQVCSLESLFRSLDRDCERTLCGELLLIGTDTSGEGSSRLRDRPSVEGERPCRLSRDSVPEAGLTSLLSERPGGVRGPVSHET